MRLFSFALGRRAAATGTGEGMVIFLAFVVLKLAFRSGLGGEILS